MIFQRLQVSCKQEMSFLFQYVVAYKVMSVGKELNKDVSTLVWLIACKLLISKAASDHFISDMIYWDY